MLKLATFLNSYWVLDGMNGEEASLRVDSTSFFCLLCKIELITQIKLLKIFNFDISKMALNPPITEQGEPYRVQGEVFILKRKGIDFEIKIDGLGKMSGKGIVNSSY